MIGLALFVFFHLAFATEMAITFDDLPAHGNLPPNDTREAVINKILLTLEKHHLSGIYGFMNGAKTVNNPENLKVLQDWVAAGQLLGNHTYTHLNLNDVSLNTYKNEIQQNDVLLAKLMGLKDYKFFRYSYLAEGKNNEERNAIRQYLFQNQYKIAPVTILFYDYKWNDPYLACLKKHNLSAINLLKNTYLSELSYATLHAQAMAQQLFHRDIAHILVIHCDPFAAENLDELLTQLEKNKVKFISLENALQDKAYDFNFYDPKRGFATFLTEVAFENHQPATQVSAQELKLFGQISHLCLD
jgi:peptidoglycan/xylan/chitin deacetylase (PgdA/CDA1 family)